MENTLEILLNSEKTINSVDVENYTKIYLEREEKEVEEYNLRNVISETEIFEREREYIEKYRIYGGIEYISILNGVPGRYTKFDDFFRKNNKNSKNIHNSFNFYLLKPSLENTGNIDGNPHHYGRFFEVIATPDMFNIYNAGFSKNIFNEQKYIFNFDGDFNIKQERDSFGFPITEFFLYAEYIPKSFFVGSDFERFEQIRRLTWDINTGFTNESTVFSVENMGLGSIIYGDIVNFNPKLFSQTTIKDQKYIISTPLDSGDELRWVYNPFIKIDLRYLSPNLTIISKNTNSFDLVNEIPDYAIEIDNTIRWRNILPQGYIDPLTGVGGDIPFVNKRRYLFSNIILDILPDLTHTKTKEVFSKIYFSSEDNDIVGYKPKDDINKIGDLCN